MRLTATVYRVFWYWFPFIQMDSLPFQSYYSMICMCLRMSDDVCVFMLAHTTNIRRFCSHRNKSAISTAHKTAYGQNCFGVTVCHAVRWRSHRMNGFKWKRLFFFLCFCWIVRCYKWQWPSFFPPHFRHLCIFVLTARTQHRAQPTSTAWRKVVRMVETEKQRKKRKN